MTLAVHWTLEVHVPQLEAIQQTLLDLGAQVMASLEGIRTEIANLVAQQAEGSDAIATQLTVIADEIDQLNAEAIDQADLDALAAQIREAAKTAHDQAAQIRANSQTIAGMVPDEPAPTPTPTPTPPA